MLWHFCLGIFLDELVSPASALLRRQHYRLLIHYSWKGRRQCYILLSADSEGLQALRSILFLYCLKRVGPLMYKRAIFCLVPVPGWPHSHQPSPVPQSDVIVRHRDHLINMEDARDGSCFPKMGQWCVQDASEPALTLLLARLKAAATKIQTTCNSPLCKSKKIHWENEDK